MNFNHVSKVYPDGTEFRQFGANLELIAPAAFHLARPTARALLRLPALLRRGPAGRVGEVGPALDLDTALGIKRSHFTVSPSTTLGGSLAADAVTVRIEPMRVWSTHADRAVHVGAVKVRRGWRHTWVIPLCAVA